MPFYPGAADYNNGIISVDQALKNPTVIEQRVAELAGKNLLVSNIFAEGGDVDGGSVIYSKITEKHLYTDADVSERQPGDEYAVVYSEQPDLQLARVQDFGGKFAVSDENRKRNNAIDFDNDTTRLANTITRKINRVAIETINAAVEAGDTNQLVYGGNWDSVQIDGATPTPPGERPHSQIATTVALADEKDLGIEYNRMVVSPSMRAQLRSIYGTDLKAVLDDFGLELISSNFVEPNRVYLIDQEKAGFVRYEDPLTITAYRDEAHRQTWVQGYAMPVMGITLPAAIGTIELAL